MQCIFVNHSRKNPTITMKLYCFLSCLPAFLLSTVGNLLPAIDNNAQPEFTELNPPSFAGQFVSQVPPNEDSMVQADTNSNLDQLLFSVSSVNPDSQTEYSSQMSIAEVPNSGSDESLCDDEPESGQGSKNVNKYRMRRDGTMCAVKEEDIDWDLLWATFSKSRELSSGDLPACNNPSYPMHVCCRGPHIKYVYNPPSIFREVRNCAPFLMLCAPPYLNLCCRTFQPLSAESPGFDCVNANSV